MNDLRVLPISTAILASLGCLVLACSSESDDGGLSTFGDPSGYTSVATATTPTTATTNEGGTDDADTGDGDGDGDTGDGDGEPGSCGDGVIDANEACDGNQLGGETCVSLGYAGGALACAGNCLDFDASGCSMGSCGNGVIDDGELCDGLELQGQTCASVGFGAGQLACDANCQTFDTSGCSESLCGNGVVEPGEVCDGANLNGQSCATQGFAGGTLSCNGDCTAFNTAGCSNGSGDCCTENLYAGCQVFAVEACVCGLDPYCCDTQWDSLCVDAAILSCNAIC